MKLKQYIAATKDQGLYGSVFIAALISCFIAFINLYPLVYSDTGTYIDSGFRNTVPDDRPVFYGLFLRHSSLAASLWFVVFVQGLLVCYTISLTLGIFFKGKKKDVILISVITFLAIFTGFSYNVCILIPDIFSSITILCLINLLLHPQLSKGQTVFTSILFIFSICTQFSALPIVLLLLCFLVLYMLIKKPAALQPKKIILAVGLFLSSLVIMPLTNYFFDGRFKISGSNEAFIMNHFIETGVLSDYLDHECAAHHYRICDYKDQLGWNFIWSDESPMQKTGGMRANKAEYNLIIRDIITTPKYIAKLSLKAFEFSFKQFFTFDVTVPAPLLEHSAPYGQINWRFKDSKKAYVSSLQSRGKLDTTFVNTIQPVVVLISMVFLVFVFLNRKLRNRLSPGLRWAVLLLLVHNIINSVICSNLSTIDSRFQNRLAWLLPLFTIIILLKILEERKNLNSW